jgi:hypothetical protein
VSEPQRQVNVDMNGVRIHGILLGNAKITDAWLVNAELHGNITGMTVNDVEVAPLIEAELDRRHPERTKLRPTTPAEVRAALDVVDDMWSATVERARKLPAERLLERVDNEYSFVETLRHLIFATDAWVTRMVFQVPNAYHECAIPPGPQRPLDPTNPSPPLDDVLAVRADRMARLREFANTAEPADLMRKNSPPDPTGHPQGEHRVLKCLHVFFNEEWWHHRYATRDLTILEAG